MGELRVTSGSAPMLTWEWREGGRVFRATWDGRDDGNNIYISTTAWDDGTRISEDDKERIRTAIWNDGNPSPTSIMFDGMIPVRWFRSRGFLIRFETARFAYFELGHLLWVPFMKSDRVIARLPRFPRWDVPQNEPIAADHRERIRQNIATATSGDWEDYNTIMWKTKQVIEVFDA